MAKWVDDSKDDEGRDTDVNTVPGRGGQERVVGARDKRNLNTQRTRVG